MHIEFPCPVCQSPLALKNKMSGGQVNCPKCHKLILLPLESPVPRHNPDTPPFQEDQTYTAHEVTQAISRSVQPYRKDLETKADLLDDAVEMVKIRNERIRELETISLKTQSELWALEADTYEDEEEPEEPQADAPASSDPEKIEHEPFNLEALFATAREALTTTGQLLPEIAEMEKQLSSQLSTLKDGSAGLSEAREWIGKCIEAMLECSSRLQEKEKARKELEDLFRSCGEDLKRANSERNHWRKRASELEQTSAALSEKIEDLQTPSAEKSP